MLKNKKIVFSAGLALASFSAAIVCGWMGETKAYAADGYIPSGENLISDGSFENSSSFGGEAAWSAYTGLDQGAIAPGMGVDNNSGGGYAVPYEGHANMFLATSADYLSAGTTLKIYQNVTVESGTEYEFSFYAKKWDANNTVPAIKYEVSYPTAEETFVALASKEYTEATSAYGKTSLSFNSGEHISLRVSLEVTVLDFAVAGGAGYHLDNVALYKMVENPIKEYVSDSSFENMNALTGETSPWFALTARDQGAEYPGIGIDNWVGNAGAYEGNGSVFIVSADGYLNVGTQIFLYQDVQLEANRIYRLSFMIKKWADGNVVSPIEYGYTDLEGNILGEASCATVTGTYGEIDYLFRSGELTRIRLFIGLHANSMDDNSGFNCGYNLDKVSVTEVELPKESVLVDEEVLCANAGMEHSTEIKKQELSAEAKNGWYDIAGAEGERRVGIDSNLGFSNTGSNNIWLLSAGQTIEKGQKLGVYQDIDVATNTWYELSFFLKKWAAGNIVAPIEFAVTETGGETNSSIAFGKFEDATAFYQKVDLQFYSGEHTSLRIAVYLTSLSFVEAGYYDTGYHIDDIEVHKLSPVKSVWLFSDGGLKNELIDYSVIVELENGNYADITESDNYTLTSSAPETVEFSGGALLAKNVGTAKVYATIDFYGKQISSVEINLNVLENTDEKGLKEVNISLNEEVTTGAYSEIQIELLLNDGTQAGTGDCTVEVYADDASVLNIYEKLSKYYVIGRKQGSGNIVAVVTQNGHSVRGTLAVEVKDGNLLTDGSFEDETVKAWTIEKTCDGGHDFSNSGEYARSGRGNLYFIAPAVNENVRPDSTAYLYQDVAVSESGYYTFAAYLQRFEGNGKTELGGLVKIGVIRLNENGEEGENTFTENGVSVGAGGYQQIAHTFKAETGVYRVYILIEGDEINGLGMQIDDCTLSSTVFATEIEVKVGSENKILLNDMENFSVFVNYEDGTKEKVTSGFICEVADPSVISLNGSFAIGRKVGTTDLTFKLDIQGRQLIKTISVTVYEEDNEDSSFDDSSVSSESSVSESQTGGCGGSISSLIASGAVLLFGAALSQIKRRKKH